MKKLMCLLAVLGLVVGCAHNQNVGGTSDQPEMNSGAYSYPTNPDPVTNRVLQAP